MDKIKPHHWITQVGVMYRRKPPKQSKPLAYYDQSVIDALRAEVDSKQARIDALMFEYCPNDMTPEQMAEWAKHQKPAGDVP